MCISALINNDDEVIIFEPAWLSYEHQIKISGAKTKFLPVDFDIRNLETVLTSKTKLLILNNPNNPAGYVYTKSELLTLTELCRKHCVTLLVDEAYCDFVDDGSFKNITDLVPDLNEIIAVNSLSKNMGMSGWRIGFVIAQEQIIKKLLILNQHLITCSPTILQLYVNKYFKKILDVTIPQARSINSKRLEVSKN